MILFDYDVLLACVCIYDIASVCNQFYKIEDQFLYKTVYNI